MKISEKTEELHHAFKEQYASKQLKLLSDKVKSFVSESKVIEEEKIVQMLPVTISEETKSDCKSDTTGEREELINSFSNDKNCVIEFSDIKATSNHNSPTKLQNIEDSTVEEEVKIPKDQTFLKRMLGNSTCDVSKKLKLYDSPLEYLKDNSRSKYVIL